MPAVATAQAERTIAPDEIDAYIKEFHQDPVTPPVVDGVGGISDAELAEYHDLVRATQAAGDPEPELVLGEMWSDTVGLPAGVDKSDADAAEIAIATQQHTLPSIDTLDALDAQIMAPASAHCKTFFFSPHQVCGAILERYEALGGQFGWLMHPVEPMHLNPDGQGYRQRFHNGFIYWHPTTGAHAVTVRNADVWARNGWEQGWLGYPLGGEVPVTGTTPADGELHGWVQLFQGGRMYRTPLNQGPQVASINGLILEKWLELGGPDSDLGFPIADEAKTADEVGRFSVFQHGSIYWHPNHGAQPVTGAIELVWRHHGAERGEYGYPTTSQYLDEEARITQDFSNQRLDLANLIPDDPQPYLAGDKKYSRTLEILMEQYLGQHFAIPGPTDTGHQTEPFIFQPHQTSPNEWNPPQNGTIYVGKIPFQIVSAIPIPYHYNYNPNPLTNDTLSDFCSYSDDIWGLRNNNNNERKAADLRGSCARHDLCYINVSDYQARVATCDRPFNQNLIDSCQAAYLPGSKVLDDCLSYTGLMYSAVKKWQHILHG